MYKEKSQREIGGEIPVWRLVKLIKEIINLKKENKRHRRASADNSEINGNRK